MERKTISVVMATYNGSIYLRPQLESILKQTKPPDEIIIADDRSSDETIQILEDFRQQCPFKVVIVQRHQRVGFRDNFLLAAMQAQGDFIAFCDQDDIWTEYKIERCSAYFDDPQISMIVHSATLIDQSSKEIGDFRQGIKSTKSVPPLTYDPWGTFWGFSIVFRRDLLNLFPLEGRFRDYISPEHRIAHDRWIVFLAQIAGTTVEIDEALVAYRQHDSNVFGQGTGSRMTTTDDIRRRSAVYIAATLEMVDIVRHLKDVAAKNFPLFNKSKALEFFNAALLQLQARDKIYRSDTRREALRVIISLLTRGGYLGVDKRKMRWRSFLRDLHFAIMRS